MEASDGNDRIEFSDGDPIETRVVEPEPPQEDSLTMEITNA